MLPHEHKQDIEVGGLVVEHDRIEIESIWDRIDDAVFYSDEKIRTAEFDKVIADLRALVEKGQIQAVYPLGYAQSCHPSRLVRQQCVESFALAIEHGVESDLSSLALARYWFKECCFLRAALHIDDVRELELAWELRARYRELDLCIKIKLDGLRASALAVAQYCAFIKSETIEDIPPLDLMDTIEDCIRFEDGDGVRQSLRLLDAAYPILGKSGFSSL